MKVCKFLGLGQKSTVWVNLISKCFWLYEPICGIFSYSYSAQCEGHQITFTLCPSDAKPLLSQLHWLPVRQRIQYKVTVLTHKVRMTGAPSYLSQHLAQHVATRQTRSTALPLLTIPRIKTEFARCSYSYSASFIWNSLPSDVLYCNSEPTFKKHLKTCLFNSCFYAAWLTPPLAPL